MPTWLTIKAALIGGAILLLLLAVQTGRLYIAHADVKAAKADLELMVSARDAAIDRAVDLNKAANSWKGVAATRLLLLQAEQAVNTRLAEDNRMAAETAAARQRAARAEADAWKKKHAALLASDSCQRAKAALEVACPVDSF